MHNLIVKIVALHLLNEIFNYNDGLEDADRAAKSMLKWVVSNGVACRSWQEMTKQ